MFINFSIYNKLEHKSILNVVNVPFLNLIYFYLNFFQIFIKNLAEELDKGDNAFFPREHYNYFKTKDEKYFSIGNLEKKFQQNFINKTGEIIKSEENKASMTMTPQNFKDNYDYDTVKDLLIKYNRDDLTEKVR
jgi:hypothetical protein